MQKARRRSEGKEEVGRKNEKKEAGGGREGRSCEKGA